MESKGENPEVESSPDEVKSKSARAGSQGVESVGATPPGIESISASSREVKSVSARSV